MAHLQVSVSAETHEELIQKCNMISLKSGQSFKFDTPVWDGKKFYTTYYIDLEMNEIFTKVSQRERSKVTKK